ncbi:hypothetical protein C8Q75DRAFT_736356 [Abortiporus biennis]|nr:hypothetical protein C8Q75DRAFT_736356 [Abortiporus biennis]
MSFKQAFTGFYTMSIRRPSGNSIQTRNEVESNTGNDYDQLVNKSAPQCCHCGWRGAHAPTCPFKCSVEDTLGLRLIPSSLLPSESRAHVAGDNKPLSLYD